MPNGTGGRRGRGGPIAPDGPDGPDGPGAPRAGAAGAALLLAGAAAAFALVARRVATGAAEPMDRAVRARAQAARTPAGDRAVRPVTLLSMPGVVLPATLGLAAWLRAHGRRGAALAAVVAPALAMTAGFSFSTFLAQRNPPDAPDTGPDTVAEPSFPSGHTTGVTAEALGLAYVLRREGLASPAGAGALIAWPVLVGVTRVYRDRHWASDVLGGWAAGTAVAAACALVYERSV